MLAYLFFHRPEATADVEAYERQLRLFHATLAASDLDGFHGSATYRVGDGYCDWYLLDGSAALDALNEAAVSGARSGPHDHVARVAVDGQGKLLRLAAGRYDAGAPFEVRFSKPPGMSYADLYARLESWTGRPGVSLWRRMMVLGPPPEFTILAPTELDLTSDLKLEMFRRAQLVDLPS